MARFQDHLFHQPAAG